MIFIVFLNDTKKVAIRLQDVCEAVLAVNCGSPKHSSGLKVLFTLEQTKGADFWFQGDIEFERSLTHEIPLKGCFVSYVQLHFTIWGTRRAEIRCVCYHGGRWEDERRAPKVNNCSGELTKGKKVSPQKTPEKCTVCVFVCGCQCISGKLVPPKKWVVNKISPTIVKPLWCRSGYQSVPEVPSVSVTRDGSAGEKTHSVPCAMVKSMGYDVLSILLDELLESI